MYELLDSFRDIRIRTGIVLCQATDGMNAVSDQITISTSSVFCIACSVSSRKLLKFFLYVSKPPFHESWLCWTVTTFHVRSGTCRFQ